MAVTTQFNGTVTTSWKETANWSNGVPDATIEATIASDCDIDEVAHCLSLNVQSTQTLDCNTYNLTVASGTLIDGTINCGTGDMSFGAEPGANGVWALNVDHGTLNGGSGVHTWGSVWAQTSGVVVLSSAETTIDSIGDSGQVIYQSNVAGWSYPISSTLVIDNGVTSVIRTGVDDDFHIAYDLVVSGAATLAKWRDGNIIVGRELRIYNGAIFRPYSETLPEGNMTVSGMTKVRGTGSKLQTFMTSGSYGDGFNGLGPDGFGTDGTNTFSMKNGDGGMIDMGGGNHLIGNLQVGSNIFPSFTWSSGTTTMNKNQYNAGATVQSYANGGENLYSFDGNDGVGTVLIEPNARSSFASYSPNNFIENRGITFPNLIISDTNGNGCYITQNNNVNQIDVLGDLTVVAGEKLGYEGTMAGWVATGTAGGQGKVWVSGATFVSGTLDFFNVRSQSFTVGADITLGGAVTVYNGGTFSATSGTTTVGGHLYWSDLGGGDDNSDAGTRIIHNDGTFLLESTGWISTKITLPTDTYGFYNVIVSSSTSNAVTGFGGNNPCGIYNNLDMVNLVGTGNTYFDRDFTIGGDLNITEGEMRVDAFYRYLVVSGNIVMGDNTKLGGARTGGLGGHWDGSMTTNTLTIGNGATFYLPSGTTYPDPDGNLGTTLKGNFINNGGEVVY